MFNEPVKYTLISTWLNDLNELNMDKLIGNSIKRFTPDLVKQHNKASWKFKDLHRI